MEEIYFGILTVSDTCYNGKNSDKSGKKLLEIISEGNLIPKSKLIHYDIVPDELTTIAQVLVKWSNEDKCNVILTTGGTGFSERDVTPEATRNIIYKVAPGLMHIMMQESLKVTPLAMLSRGVCGIRKKTLIINLPGSMKGAVECLTFVSSAIPHAVHLLRNNTDEVVKTHIDVQAKGPEVPLQIRKSKVNVSAVAFRARKSPYKMLEVYEALKCISNLVQPLGIIKLKLSDALGYILAENVTAIDPLPPFNASIKDGYAVIAADGSGIRNVQDAVSAGEMPKNKIITGICVRINTGAPIPDGADAVVQVEDTELVEASEDGTQEIKINITSTPRVGLDIRPKGCDIEENSVVLVKGTELKAVELGLLATVGLSSVSVYRKPIIGLLSTGNELQNPGEKLKPGHIRDSNKTTLTALFTQLSYDTIDCGVCRDNPDEVLTTIENALDRCDILISTGGVSMGDKDLIKQVLKEDFQADIHFGRVNMKPGKPTTFATCNFKGSIKYIFALPGNPVSATVTAQLFVLQALNRMSDKFDHTKIKIEVGEDLKLDKERPEYHRAVINWEGENGPIAYSTGNQMSSRLKSLLSADCLLILPAAITSNEVIKKGDKVNAILLKC